MRNPFEGLDPFEVIRGLKVTDDGRPDPDPPARPGFSYPAGWCGADIPMAELPHAPHGDCPGMDVNRYVPGVIYPEMGDEALAKALYFRQHGEWPS